MSHDEAFIRGVLPEALTFSGLGITDYSLSQPSLEQARLEFQSDW